MAKPLHETLEITEWDMHRPCVFCGSPECDPDDMDLWIAHLATWHGYKVSKDTPGSADGAQPRTVRLQQVGWSPHARFAANQHVAVRYGAFDRAYAGRRGIVVGWNPATSEFAITFSGKPATGLLLSNDLDTVASEA
jgi:hypothetical protein